MKTTLKAIGNSKGIIIPDNILKICKIDKEVFLEIKGDKIMISKKEIARKGWEEAFANVVPDKQEMLIDDDLANCFDHEEWSW